jgi:hypothetical protein
MSTINGKKEVSVEDHAAIDILSKYNELKKNLDEAKAEHAHFYIKLLGYVQKHAMHARFVDVSATIYDMFDDFKQVHQMCIVCRTHLDYHFANLLPLCKDCRIERYSDIKEQPSAWIYAWGDNMPEYTNWHPHMTLEYDEAPSTVDRLKIGNCLYLIASGNQQFTMGPAYGCYTNNHLWKFTLCPDCDKRWDMQRPFSAPKIEYAECDGCRVEIHELTADCIKCESMFCPCRLGCDECYDNICQTHKNIYKKHSKGRPVNHDFSGVYNSPYAITGTIINGQQHLIVSLSDNWECLYAMVINAETGILLPVEINNNPVSPFEQYIWSEDEIYNPLEDKYPVAILRPYEWINIRITPYGCIAWVNDGYRLLKLSKPNSKFHMNANKWTALGQRSFITGDIVVRYADPRIPIMFKELEHVFPIEVILLMIHQQDVTIHRSNPEEHWANQAFAGL